MGFNRMCFVLAVVTLLSLMLDALGKDAWGVAVIVVASAWAGWAAFTNHTVGCWKCAGVWLLLIVTVCGATAWATSLHTRSVIWGPIAGIAAVESFQGIKNVWATPGTTRKAL